MKINGQINAMMQLIPFSQQHFSTLASWFSGEADIIQWGGPKLHYPLDLPQMETMLAESHCNPPSRLCWMAVLDNILIGHIQLAFDWPHGNVTVGRVVIAPEQRGHGYAKPMLKLVMAEAFSFPQTMRLELNVYSFNLPAIRTYQQVGFVYEGTRRSSISVDGERWDTNMMSILRSEHQPQS
jgi:RimJ/RimL family protein N-acetyltransferase